jgi:3-phosphoshikimate 1-carboxyvinyltransferase
MGSLTLTPFDRPFQATITPPGSKSLTNRALVLAALALGESTISNILIADDTRVMLDGLRALGFNVTEDGTTVRVTGRGGAIPASSADIYCGNSGTTIRFLAALCALGHGTYRLDGDPRMRERPIGDLVSLLSTLGATVTFETAEGYPPLTVHASGLHGGEADWPASGSSQYLSAVLLASPYATKPVTIALGPGQTSWPYVEMTLALMRAFGASPEVERDAAGEPIAISVPLAAYTAREYQVEPDASNATYFMAAAAIREGASVTVPALGSDSLQGDIAFTDVLPRMGADVTLAEDSVTVRGTSRLDGIEIDMTSMPDAAMTLAVIAVFASGPTLIDGLQTLRIKETERLSALQAELTRLGATASIEGDSLRIIPPANVTPAEIETYSDHRMAMAFAVVGTRAPGITILNPACVSKTYPNFFADLESLRPA